MTLINDKFYSLVNNVQVCRQSHHLLRRLSWSCKRPSGRSTNYMLVVMPKFLTNVDNRICYSAKGILFKSKLMELVITTKENEFHEYNSICIVFARQMHKFTLSLHCTFRIFAHILYEYHDDDV